MATLIDNVDPQIRNYYEGTYGSLDNVDPQILEYTNARIGGRDLILEASIRKSNARIVAKRKATAKAKVISDAKLVAERAVRATKRRQDTEAIAKAVRKGDRVTDFAVSTSLPVTNALEFQRRLAKRQEVIASAQAAVAIVRAKASNEALADVQSAAAGPNTLEALVNTMSNKVSSVPEAVTKVAVDAYDSTINTYDKGLDKAEKAVDDIKKRAATAIDSVASEATSMFDSLIAKAKSVATDAEKAATDLYRNTDLGEVAKDLKYAAEDAATAASRALKDATTSDGAIKETIKSTKRKTEDKATNIKREGTGSTKAISNAKAVKGMIDLTTNQAIPEKVRNVIKKKMTSMRSSEADKWLTDFSKGLLESDSILSDAEKEAYMSSIEKSTGKIWVKEHTTSKGVRVKGFWRKRAQR